MSSALRLKKRLLMIRSASSRRRTLILITLSFSILNVLRLPERLNTKRHLLHTKHSSSLSTGLRLMLRKLLGLLILNNLIRRRLLLLIKLQIPMNLLLSKKQ
jgi:hypothetical protein